MELAAAAGAIVAWSGGALLVLSEGRLGLALGLALAGAGLALASVDQPPAASSLLVAGAVSAVLRARDGRPGWQVLPAGSTPSLLLALVTGVVGAFAASLLQQPDPAGARVAAVLVGTLAAARMLNTSRRTAALAAASAFCLAVALFEFRSEPAGTGVGFAAAAAAGLLGLLPGKEVARDGT